MTTVIIVLICVLAILTGSTDTVNPFTEIFANENINTTKEVTPGKVHLKALKQANAFLEHIQEKIRISRQLLESVDYNKILSPTNLTTDEEFVAAAPTFLRVTEFLGMRQGSMDTTTLKTTLQDKDRSLSSVSRKRVTPHIVYVPPPSVDYHDIILSRNFMREAEEEAIRREIAVATPPHTASPGDVLLSLVKQHDATTPDTHPVLHHEMEIVGAGYLSVGFQTLCNLIATKEPDHVRDVMSHTEGILVRKTNGNNQLNWLGQPMLSVLVRVVQLASAMSMDEIKTFTRMLVDMMKNRRQYLSSEVNYILDYADDLIETQDGDHLFDVLTEFRNYPNTTKTGLELCEALFAAFETPYLTIANTEECKKLVLAANNAFKKRSPKLHAQFRSIANKNETLLQNSKRSNKQVVKMNLNKNYYLKTSTNTFITQPGFNYEQSLRRYRVQSGISTRKLKPIEHKKQQIWDIKKIYHSDLLSTMDTYDDEISKNMRNKELVMLTGHNVDISKNGYPQKRFNIVTPALTNRHTNENGIMSSNFINTNTFKNSKRRATKSFPRAYENKISNTTYENNILNRNKAKISLPIGDIRKLNLHRMVDLSNFSDDEVLKMRLMDHLVHYNVSYHDYKNNTVLDTSQESDVEIVLKSHLYKALNV